MVSPSIQLGEVYKIKTGEELRIIKFDYPDGEFQAIIKGLDGNWSTLIVSGKASRLPEWLSENAAKRVL